MATPPARAGHDRTTKEIRLRYCFLLRVREDLLAEYRERHAQVWREMQQALCDAGWRNYSIFARPDGLLVGYVEANNLDAAQRAMAATEVNARWQAEMSRYFVGLAGRGPDQSLELLDEIFHLDDTLTPNSPIPNGGAR